jgi:endonuclease/exonuclease/phosphatase family metal-dependent hydrolase
MRQYKATLYALSAMLLCACATGSSSFHRIADGESFPEDKTVAYDYQPADNRTLKIVTLNIAHGRNQTANQLLLNEEGIKRNINHAAHVLKRVNADIVALQEADGPSVWSGNFDHVELLARYAGYPWYYRANHAQSWLFNYGTAVLSRVPVDEILQHTFSPSPPTFNKGFLLSTIRWTHDSDSKAVLSVDVISVHLDFSRRSVRKKQVAELSAALSERQNPVIILGDFNSEWSAEGSVVKRLADELGMSVYKPLAEDLHTYKSANRYDWILISSDLKFVKYEVLPDLISDHLAVVAVIMLEDSSNESSTE